MPTPRQVTQVMQQIRTQDVPSPAGSWLSGTVVSVPVGSGSYVVQLDNGDTVVADSTIDDPISVGAAVWTIASGSTTLIVGLQ